jgi:hypothetical protein
MTSVQWCLMNHYCVYDTCKHSHRLAPYLPTDMNVCLFKAMQGQFYSHAESICPYRFCQSPILHSYGHKYVILMITASVAIYPIKNAQPITLMAVQRSVHTHQIQMYTIRISYLLKRMFFFFLFNELRWINNDCASNSTMYGYVQNGKDTKIKFYSVQSTVQEPW